MSEETKVTRREFLKTGAEAGAGMAAFSRITFITQPNRVFGASDRVAGEPAHRRDG